MRINDGLEQTTSQIFGPNKTECNDPQSELIPPSILQTWLNAEKAVQNLDLLPSEPNYHQMVDALLAVRCNIVDARNSIEKALEELS